MSGPQVDIPVGGQSSSSGMCNPSSSSSSPDQNDGSSAGWNGLTIKEILEKVDLFNITVDEGDGDGIKQEKVLVGGKQVKQQGQVRRTLGFWYCWMLVTLRT